LGRECISSYTKLPFAKKHLASVILEAIDDYSHDIELDFIWRKQI
jgi:hypothetical protein